MNYIVVVFYLCEVVKVFFIRFVAQAFFFFSFPPILNSMTYPESFLRLYLRRNTQRIQQTHLRDEKKKIKIVVRTMFQSSEVFQSIQPAFSVFLLL